MRRFLFSSSCSNCGAGGGALLDEPSPLRPVTRYGESKVRVERDLNPPQSESFTVVSLRSATAYGVSPRLRCDVVVNNLVAWAATAGRVRLMTDGTPCRPLAHVADIAQALLLTLDAPASLVGGKAYNGGATAASHQVRDLARVVAEIVPGCAVEIAPDASPDTRNYRVDCDRFANELGFQPRWDIRSGAVELYEAFTKVGLVLDDVEGPRFQQVAQIRSLIGSGRLGPDLRFTV